MFGNKPFHVNKTVAAPFYLKNKGLQVLKQINKVPADLNAKLAKLLHLFSAPPAWAKNAEQTQRLPEKNRRACVYRPLRSGRREFRLMHDSFERIL